LSADKYKIVHSSNPLTLAVMVTDDIGNYNQLTEISIDLNKIV